MKLFNRHLKNERGMTMIELMVAGALGTVLLGVTIMVFTFQEKTMKNENEATEVRAKGRQAINTIAKEIRMAGKGLPPNEGITSMGTTSISFMSNLDDKSTTVPPASSGSAIAASATSISVISSSDFAVDDYMVIYDPASSTSHYAAVTALGTGSLDFTPAISGSITFGANSRYVAVNQYQIVTIALSGTSVEKTVDPSSASGDSTTTTITDQAFTGTGLEFAYYDEDFAVTAVTSAVRKIAITLRMPNPQNPSDASSVREFKTDVEVRNNRS